MKASDKKHIERLDNSFFLGRNLTAIHRDNGSAFAGVVTDASNREVTVEFDNGKFEPTVRRFRRDTGTQRGGDFRLDFSLLVR